MYVLCAFSQSDEEQEEKEERKGERIFVNSHCGEERLFFSTIDFDGFHFEFREFKSDPKKAIPPPPIFK